MPLLKVFNEVTIRTYGGLIDFLAKRECDNQIYSYAKTLNHEAVG